MVGNISKEIGVLIINKVFLVNKIMYKLTDTDIGDVMQTAMEAGYTYGFGYWCDEVKITKKPTKQLKNERLKDFEYCPEASAVALDGAVKMREYREYDEHDDSTVKWHTLDRKK